MGEFYLCWLCGTPTSDELCGVCRRKRVEAQSFADEGFTLEEVSKKFGFKENLLKKAVKDGKFRCTTSCKICGKVIQIGKVCDECKQHAKVALRDLDECTEESSGVGFHSTRRRDYGY